MLFVIRCIDKKDHLSVRMETRAAHLEYVGVLGNKLVSAGPTLDPETGDMNGSILILDLENRSEAEKFCENDPYALAGLFDSVEIMNWKKVLPAN